MRRMLISLTAVLSMAAAGAHAQDPSSAAATASSPAEQAAPESPIGDSLPIPRRSRVPDGLPTAVTLLLLCLSMGYWVRTRKRVAYDKLQKRLQAPEKYGLPPSLQGTFNIVRVLGEGGMGVVYEAVDRSLDRRVAIKKLREDSEQADENYERLLKEAKTVAVLRHPNIVEIFSVVGQGGEVYLVFEFVDGRTLEDVLRECRRMSVQETKNTLYPVCKALQYAHRRGIIHRDLKPGNIMIGAKGDVKVMDFGIARQLKERNVAVGSVSGGATITHNVVGTPLYMSPEAEYGLICPESDIFALGVMAYQMLTGALPYGENATASQKMACEYSNPSSRVAELAPEVDEFIAEALTGEYQKRIRTITDFWNQLNAL